MTAIGRLEERTRFLRNAAPQEFDNFRLAFGDYTRFMTESMVNATGDLSVAQGRAQQCLKILRVLEEIKDG
jgi:hypothetical protein